MRNVSDKSCRENQNTHFVFNDYFPENRGVYEITWKKYGTARQATRDNTIWRMRIACWIPKATNTHSQYVTLIAFPLQQWLHERASLLRHTYVACLVCLVISVFESDSRCSYCGVVYFVPFANERHQLKGKMA